MRNITESEASYHFFYHLEGQIRRNKILEISSNNILDVFSYIISFSYNECLQFTVKYIVDCELLTLIIGQNIMNSYITI